MGMIKPRVTGSEGAEAVRSVLSEGLAIRSSSEITLCGGLKTHIDCGHGTWPSGVRSTIVT